MKEIGGYIELDTYNLPMLHEGAVPLNCGRNALAFLIRCKRIKKLWIPKFICDSIIGVCEREKVQYSFYNIGLDFLPSHDIELGTDEWLYFVNYYSQFDNDKINEFHKKYQRIIVDHAQSYFQEPIKGVDTLYSCRKYFGVPDGAFLYTDEILDAKYPQDESFNRMRFLLGRYERTASEFYSEYAENNELFVNEPIKKMSKLTYNLLHGINYQQVKNKREDNYSYLQEVFASINELELSKQPGTFMYPLMVKSGARIRKQLQENNIYIPMLWPTVGEFAGRSSIEYMMAENILPLPIDQRYEIEDMNYIVHEVFKYIN